ncbi:hypothetical protein J2Z32_000475 [Paenibacillus turicensis]|uniref:Peptidase C39-like domain-containing protein n=1 Tax=Paenibacillus turicensis TaxID=160487 RepID=A0ABS4FMP9_9BACL|nr:hypothetical protein [Paenibacillus turicensis]MBP1903863.1 hypothetical protein [Paenibacillus turicensis]
MKSVFEPSELGLLLKKVMSLLIAFFLIAPYTGNVASANTDLSLNNAKFLEKEEVLQIVQNNLDGYLSTDIQTYGKKLIASKDFLPLYDLDHNIFAYMVPIIEQDQEVGYITVGAIVDGYATYEINIQPQKTLSNIRAMMQKNEDDMKGNNVEIVFIPPFDYLLKVSDSDGNDRYFDLAIDDQDVTEKVIQRKADLVEGYARIRKPQNEEHIQSLLESTSFTTTAVPVENVALTIENNYGMFIPVEYSSGNYSYGGDQGWYSTSTKRERGCGPVAAANITNYLAKIKNSSLYGNLYVGNTSSKTDFVSHMDKLYSYINPGLFGEISVNSFKSSVEKFASDRGVSLNGVTNSSSFTLDNVANYIKAGLNINSPVATLNTKKWSDYEYEWHWMTITKYYRDGNDNRWIAVSTWGQRRSIDYRVHFDAMKYGYWMGGVMYFN